MERDREPAGRDTALYIEAAFLTVLIGLALIAGAIDLFA